MIYVAYMLRAKFNSGLVLSGQNSDGELEFVGTDDKFKKADELEKRYEEIQ